MPVTIDENSLNKYVKSIESFSKSSYVSSEINTRRKLIDPLIEVLGWDMGSDEVNLEYAVTIGTRTAYVDYALGLNGKPLVLVEAKPYNSSLTEDYSTQTISYGRVDGVRWVALTNGKSLKIFDTKAGKSEKESLICTIDLRNPSKYLEELSLLHKESIRTGETVEVADRILHRKQALLAIKEKQSELSEGFSKVISGIIGDINREQTREISKQLAEKAAEIYESTISISSSQKDTSATEVIRPINEKISLRVVDSSKPELAERHILRREFWKQLIEYSKNKTSLFSNISPGIENWLSKGAGKSGLSYNYVILKNASSIELYIDTGEVSKNKNIFDQLYSHKQNIEKELGISLLWDRLDEKRACRISKKVDEKGLRDKDSWSNIIEKMVKDMINFEKVMSTEIKQLTY
jgi:predicted type IV restriction endonuclease